VEGCDPLDQASYVDIKTGWADDIGQADAVDGALRSRSGARLLTIASVEFAGSCRR
jgi:hypothetical protein